MLLLPASEDYIHTQNRDKGEVLGGLGFGYQLTPQSIQTCPALSEWNEVFRKEFHNKKALKRDKQGLPMQPPLS